MKYYNWKKLSNNYVAMGAAFGPSTAGNPVTAAVTTPPPPPPTTT